MALIQLDFFRDSEIVILEARMDKVEESSAKVRRGIFARNGATEKRMKELEARLEILERHICQGAKE